MRANPQTYALTVVAFERRRLFQRIANAELLITTMIRYREGDRFLLHGFVVMPDHLHVLLTPAEPIEKAAQLIKGGFSFAVREQYAGEVWQGGYFAHRVTDADDYAAQLSYIAANPVRKGLDRYRFVHTSCEWHLDPKPSHFLADGR